MTDKKTATPRRELAVFIGRFQPFHNGHKQIIDTALQTAKRVLILAGSSFEPRSLRNPWYFDEREAMIRACYSADENKRLIVEPIMDVRYNNASWLTQIQRAVYDHHTGDDNGVTLIGKSLSGKGRGFYTTLFPQWDQTPVSPHRLTNGLAIRDHLLSGQSATMLGDDVPAALLGSLDQFMASSAGTELKKEYDFIKQYKKGWENASFEPTHVTVDAVVVQSGHILLVKRGAYPGKGLFALPGGFIHAEETLQDAIIRKLREETQIKVPSPVLAGSIKNQMVFDDPFRSVRGRTITHSFHIELRSEAELPKIKGNGASGSCFWLPLGQLDSTLMFEDHYFIIQKMLGLV